MPRLKSREHFVPGEFQMLLPETGQEKPFKGSFRFCCEEVLRLINGNPFLANKHGWPTDMDGVEQMVENYNVQRCLAGGWYDWLTMDAPPPPPPGYNSQKKTPLRNVAAGVSRIKAGIGVLLDWLGDGGIPVEPALANRRAAICSACPKNGKGDFTSYFTKPIAEKIRLQLEMRNEMQLLTPHDSRLGVCEACLCPLKLKTHAPLTYALKHLEEDVRKELDKNCWMLHEQPT